MPPIDMFEEYAFRDYSDKSPNYGTPSSDEEEYWTSTGRPYIYSFWNLPQEKKERPEQQRQQCHFQMYLDQRGNNVAWCVDHCSRKPCTYAHIELIRQHKCGLEDLTPEQLEPYNITVKDVQAELTKMEY